MAKVKNIEKKIWEVEGFDVILLHEDGRNIHGAMGGVPQYPFTNAAKNGMTVSDWKTKRFNATYPGYKVDVLNGDGVVIAAGNTLLSTVRDTYSEDE